MMGEAVIWFLLVVIAAVVLSILEEVLRWPR